jgi:hypothetical protein
MQGHVACGHLRHADLRRYSKVSSLQRPGDPDISDPLIARPDVRQGT